MTEVFLDSFESMRLWQSDKRQHDGVHQRTLFYELCIITFIVLVNADDIVSINWNVKLASSCYLDSDLTIKVLTVVVIAVVDY